MQTKERHLETAFPVPIGQTADDRQGMSLRDFFAAQTLSGFIMVNMNGDELPAPIELAKAAYLIADSMIAVRASSVDYVMVPKSLAKRALEYMESHQDEGPTHDVGYKSEQLKRDIEEFEPYTRLGE